MRRSPMDGDSLAVVEGPKLVREACGSGLEVEEIFVASSKLAGFGEEDWSGKAGAALYGVSDRLFQALSETVTSQGILAIVRIPLCSPGFPADRESLSAHRPPGSGPREPGNAGPLGGGLRGQRALAHHPHRQCSQPQGCSGFRRVPVSTSRCRAVGPRIPGRPAAPEPDSLDGGHAGWVNRLQTSRLPGRAGPGGWKRRPGNPPGFGGLRCRSPRAHCQRGRFAQCGGRGRHPLV